MDRYIRKKKICAILMFVILKLHYEKQKISQKRLWIKPWRARRQQQGCFRNLFTELQLEDPDKYRR